MAVTVIEFNSVDDDQAFALSKHLDVMESLLAAVSAKTVSRYSLDEDVVGMRPARTMVVMEFPSRAAIDQVFNSHEYAEAKPYRDLAFLGHSVHVASRKAA